MLFEIQQWTRLQESNYIYQKNCVGELCWNCVVSSETVRQTCTFAIISKVLRQANSTQEKNNQCKRMVDIGLRILQTNTLNCYFQLNLIYITFFPFRMVHTWLNFSQRKDMKFTALLDDLVRSIQGEYNICIKTEPRIQKEVSVALQNYQSADMLKQQTNEAFLKKHRKSTLEIY